ncbi:pyruvate formate lyase family protein, partial [Thermodesulfobacteriota bacterium]
SDVEKELESTPIRSVESFNKTAFLEALTIVIRAGIQYGKRYAALARDLAKKEEGIRKDELEKMAEVCEWVPGNPARTFHEALQTMWFCLVMIYWDTGGAYAAVPGRVDQYLYPYYQRDMEEGRITNEDVIDLLECLRVKMSAFRKFRSTYSLRGTSGEATFLNCTLGGQTVEGEDAVNELSYLWIEAAMRTKTPHPTLSIRWHDNLSPDFAMKAAELNRLGLGFPAWFGNESQIQYLLGRGIPREEAWDYALAGCVLSTLPGKSAATWPMILSMPKILELALHDGVDPATGKQFGPNTGRFEDFKAFEELIEAYKEQVDYFIRHDAKNLNKMRISRSVLLPQLAASYLFDDCIERGDSPVGGGSRYQDGAMYLLPIGIIDVVDSLAAIKRYIYEEKSIDKAELIAALADNFQGKEDVLRLLLDAPKFGNDNDYVDNIAVDLYSWICNLLEGVDACYGAKYVCAPHSISFQGSAGETVGALPSGRLAGLSLADGGVSPGQGWDKSGPTAVIKSAGKIDQVPIYGTLFNMKFLPSSLKTKEDLTKFLILISTYLGDYGGQHIQFNVIDREILLDAQRHPKNYGNLVVRVAGYSALWVELHREIQDELIKRTEHDF